LQERAGRSAKGTIMAFFTVLVDGDDKNDPLGETLRKIKELMAGM
jgi:flagellum-specific ATP synthase